MFTVGGKLCNLYLDESTYLVPPAMNKLLIIIKSKIL